MDWEDEIRTRFPDWQTDAALTRWAADRFALQLGQQVSGIVIARAPFGVWLDIGVSFPALLLVPNMAEANERRITFGDYPGIGTSVAARINALGEWLAENKKRPFLFVHNSAAQWVWYVPRPRAASLERALRRCAVKQKTN